MSTLNTILMLTLILASAAITSATSPDEEEDFFLRDTKPAALRGGSRFLAGQRRRLTCDSHPQACESKGNTICCNKKCVNVKTDKLNCGACGKKCKFSEICCNGRCVNPSANKNHCGGCGNSCQEGGFCAFGMCSYSYA